MRFATSNPSRLTILAVLLGLLAFPSECSRFPGPHSLFMNVDAMVMDDVATQDGPGAAQRHGDHRPARGSGVSVFDIPTGQADVATSGPDAMPDAATAPPSSTAQRTPPPPAQTAQTGPRTVTAAELRRIWPDVLEEVKRRRRFTYMMLSQHAQVLDVSDGQLLLGFANPGARESFGGSGSIDVLADCLIEVIGVELRIQAILSNQPPPPQHSRPASAPVTPAAAPTPAAQAHAAPAAPAVPAAVVPAAVTVDSSEAEEDDAPLGNLDEAASGLLADAFDAEIIGVEEPG